MGCSLWWAAAWTHYLKKIFLKNLSTNVLYIISRNFQSYNYLSEGNLNGKLKF